MSEAMLAEDDDELFPFDDSIDDGEDDESREEVNPTLEEVMSAENVANILPQRVLAELVEIVIREYEIDEDNRRPWLEKTNEAMKLAFDLDKSKTKAHPWTGAANVIYPLIIGAALQFNADSFPAIVSPTGVAKAKKMGRDPAGKKAARANRISSYMNFQLDEEMINWETDTDRLLLTLSIVGAMFRKMWWHPGEMASCSKLVWAKNLVLPWSCTSIEDAPRATEILELRPDEIVTRRRSGVFRDIDYGPQEDEDTQAPLVFLEQHRRYDLDGDGYPEPCIVTVSLQTRLVARIVPAFDPDDINVNDKGEVVYIKPFKYYQQYTFIPDPAGGPYGVGFGLLLHDITATISTMLNQLIDSGTLANTGGGFIGGGLKIRGGALKFSPGEYKHLPEMGGVIKDNIVALNFPGPSQVLFSVMTFLVEAGKELASMTKAMTGEAPRNQPATTTLAMLERGMAVTKAINKRIFKSVKGELQLLYIINSRYGDEEKYLTFLDENVPQENVTPPVAQPDPSGAVPTDVVPQQFPQAVGAAPGDPMAAANQGIGASSPTALVSMGSPVISMASDFNEKDMDVVPVADPNSVTNMQRVQRVQAQTEIILSGIFEKSPAAGRRMLEELGVEDADELEPKPDPAAMELQARMQEAEIKMAEAEAQKAYAESLLMMAKVDQSDEAVETGRQRLEIERERVGVARQQAATGDKKVELDALLKLMEAEKEDKSVPGS